MSAGVRGIGNRYQGRDIWRGLTQDNLLNIGDPERLGSLFGGVLLLFYALTRSWFRIISLLLGGYLIYRGLTGYCPTYKALNMSTARSKLRFDDEYNEHPTGTVDEDDVWDEAVWQSFPASDSPASW